MRMLNLIALAAILLVGLTSIVSATPVADTQPAMPAGTVAVTATVEASGDTLVAGELAQLRKEIGAAIIAGNGGEMVRLQQRMDALESRRTMSTHRRASGISAATVRRTATAAAAAAERRARAYTDQAVGAVSAEAKAYADSAAKTAADTAEANAKSFAEEGDKALAKELIGRIAPIGAKADAANIKADKAAGLGGWAIALAILALIAAAAALLRFRPWERTAPTAGPAP